jgi:ABC-type glycerol-3-phosphate transport system permease component
VYAWQSAHIPQFTVNSLIVSIATVGLTLALASTAAFGLSRFRFRGGRLIYLAFVLLLTIPVQIYIIPLYVVVVRLRLADNFLGLILPYTAGSLPLAVFLFKTAFDGLPGEVLPIVWTGSMGFLDGNFPSKGAGKTGGLSALPFVGVC